MFVSSTSQTALTRDGARVALTDAGNFSVASVNLRAGGVLQFSRIDGDVSVTTAWLEVKFGGVMRMDHGLIDAGDVDLEATGLLDLRARGPTTGPGAGAGSCGGSHGGLGGGVACHGEAYGSYSSPLQMGSGGGGVEGGAGGGRVRVRVGRQLFVDGVVTVAGGAGANATGGGSGGTIFVEAYDMLGHGVLNASGGRGGGGGGGGAGGRIAVHIEANNTYGGVYVASGGAGGATCREPDCSGGPGTVYKYESSRGPQYRELKYDSTQNRTIMLPEHTKLTVDNGALVTSNPGVVLGSLRYEFDEVQVEGYSYVHFEGRTPGDAVRVVIHELTGNKRGLVRVQLGQVVTVGVVEAVQTFLDAPAGFHVDAGGELVLPRAVVLRAEAVILEGALSGVETLTVERGGELVLGWGAGGRLQLSSLSVTNGGVLTARSSVVIAAAVFTVKTGGRVACEGLHTQVVVAHIDVERGGVISGTGFGHPAGRGPGAGHLGIDAATGGGHAGEGRYPFHRGFLYSNLHYIVSSFSLGKYRVWNTKYYQRKYGID